MVRGCGGPCSPGAGMGAGMGAGSGLAGAGDTDLSLWLEQPGSPGDGSVAPVCAGSRGERGSRDFSASHSSERDINNTDYFRLPFVRVWNLPAASTEAWPWQGGSCRRGSVPGVQPGGPQVAMCCRGCEVGEHLAVFPC